MEATDSSRSRTKRNSEGSTDVRDVGAEGGRNSDSDDRRRHRSSQPRRHGSGDGAEEHDSGRSDDRKRPRSPRRSASRDEDEHNVRRESSSKSARRSSDDRGDRRSSEGHRDREAEGSRRSRDEDSERSSSMKGSIRSSGRESSQSRIRSRVGSPREDSSYAERKDSSREKSHGKREQETHSQHSGRDDKDTGRRDQETGRSDNDSKSAKASDYDKHELSRDRTVESHYESREAKGQSAGSGSEKDVKCTGRGERRVDGERGSSRNISETQDDNNGPVTAPSAARSDVDRDDKLQKPREKNVEPDGHNYNSKSRGEKGEKHRPQGDSTHGGHEKSTNRERSVDMDEDKYARTRDRSDRDGGHGKRSRSPERAGKHHRDLDDHNRGFTGSDSERSSGFKSTEREGEYRDGRPPKRRETSWIDKSKEGESSKDNRKRSQSRQDSRDRETGFDQSRDWEVRREKVRAGSENFHSRPGYRRDTRMRPEGGNSSSNFGNQNENYEMMEPTNSHGFGRQESSSMFSGRRTEMGSQQEFASSMNEEWGRPPEEKGKLAYGYEDDLQGGQKAPTDSDSLGVEQSSGSGAQTPRGGSFGRAIQHGQRGARAGRGGRLTGRENQRVGVPMPMMGSPFGHLGLPSPQMQPITPNMQHPPVPHIGQGVLIPPFQSPLVWPGARGIDMNMLAMPPNLPPIPPGLAGARYPPNMGIGTNHDMYYNQPGPGRAALPNMSNPGLNATGTNGRGVPHDKGPAGWGTKKNSGPFGKAPSRGEQNDYSQNFVDTGVRPQNFIRELELTNVVEDYPKLRELIQKKDEIVANSASTPMYYKCDLRERVLSPELFGTKFDVILVDPPWEEYVHRAPGVTDQMEYWTFEEIQNLKIEAIADTPSFIFLWVGDGVGLEQGRQCLKKWGFRRCEDICWVKTNKVTATPGLRHDSHTLFQHTKEHCLMGIKGTVRRSIDGHIIHANIDTDVIIGEEPPYGSTIKPDEMYRIIEHFALGKRRLELFGEDHNIRSGWLTIGKGLSSSNFNAETYIRNFADEDGKVWQGVGGRNPPLAAPHLVVTTPDIESLRPKSPPPKNQQQPIPVMSTGNSNNRRSMGNSLQIPLGPNSGPNLENSGSEPATPVPWGASPMRGMIGPDSGHGGADDKFYQGYGFNPAQSGGDSGVNML